MTLTMRDGPTDAWAEFHRWHTTYEMELRLPEDQAARVMLLPLWGWAEARLRYRLVCYVTSGEIMDRLAYDVFEGPDDHRLHRSLEVLVEAVPRFSAGHARTTTSHSSSTSVSR